jgi:hypothetical protein
MTDVDYIFKWPDSNTLISYKFNDIEVQIKPETDLLHYLYSLLNNNNVVPQLQINGKINSFIIYISKKNNQLINYKTLLNYVTSDNLNFPDMYTNNILKSLRLLIQYIKMIKINHRGDFTNPIVIRNIGQIGWIIIKSIALRFNCFDEIIRIIEHIINTNIGYGYIVRDCNPLEKRFETDPNPPRCSNEREELLTYQLSSCNRAIRIRTDKKPYIIIYNTVLYTHDIPDDNYINLKYRQKYLKYKQKYLKLKQIF